MVKTAMKELTNLSSIIESKVVIGTQYGIYTHPSGPLLHSCNTDLGLRGV